MDARNIESRPSAPPEKVCAEKFVLAISVVDKKENKQA